MRLSGNLKSWNDDRGFGFIAQSNGGADIFVHVSEFSLSGNRPVIGEKLTYELGRGSDGRLRAVKVVRLNDRADRSSRSTNARNAKTGFPILEVCAFVIITAIGGTWGYQRFLAPSEQNGVPQVTQVPQPSATAVVPDAVTVPKPAPSTYSCDGRTYCSQMTSCAEATWFLNNCPGTKMDGNHDGIPCERQWCS